MALLPKKTTGIYKQLVNLFSNKKRYTTLEVIGKGGLAQVSSCFDTYLNRIVAIKELKDENLENPMKVKSFINEAKLIGYLDHPGVISIYDTFLCEANKPCYVMKLIDGATLSCHLKKDPQQHCRELSLVNTIQIFTKLCETLSYVHDRGVIHLDLKPDNIMVGRYGEVMVMDWGSAWLYDKKPYHDYLSRVEEKVHVIEFEDKAENFILGTPKYLSPEQTLYPRSELTPSSDIFSVGVILYQMLTGVHPFASNELKELLVQIRKHVSPPVHELNPDIPRRLSQICSKMLQKDIQSRYNSFTQIVADLAEFNDSGQAFLTRSFNSGDVIFDEGASGDYAFVILSGKVEISKTAKGRQVVLASLGPNEIVGELAIFTHQSRSATAKAIEPTTIRIMSKEDVESELEKLRPWVGKMITGLSKRFIGLNDKIIELEKNSF